MVIDVQLEYLADITVGEWRQIRNKQKIKLATYCYKQFIYFSIYKDFGEF